MSVRITKNVYIKFISTYRILTWKLLKLGWVVVRGWEVILLPPPLLSTVGSNVECQRNRLFSPDMVICISRVVHMDEGTIKTENPKCRLYWCLIEFIDWRYSQSWWYFRPLLWPSAVYLFSDPPPPLPKVNVQYIQTVCGCGGVLSCVVDNILQDFNTLFLTDSEPKILPHRPKQKHQ